MKNEGFVKKFIKSKIFTNICILIALLIVFTVWSLAIGRNFLTLSTMRNILQSLVVTSFLTIGAGCLLIAGNVDLSMSSIGAMGGMIIAGCIKSGMPGIVAIIIGFVISGILGFVNGVLVSKFRFPAFIATLGMSSIAKGATYLFSGAFNNGTAVNINFKDPLVTFLGKQQFLGIPVSVFIMIIFFIIYGILISKTRFGMKMVLVGGNPVAAQLAGLKASKIITILFVNGAVLGCVSGLFNSARMNQGALLALGTNQFTGMTAAILGGISFGGGVGGMGGAFIGLLILNTFQIGMTAVGANSFWIQVFSGILLLGALAVDFFQMRAKTTKKA